MSNTDNRMTDEEFAVLDLLSSAWNKYLALPKVHDDDQADFRRAINAAQNIIAYRVARRVDPAIWL